MCPQATVKLPGGWLDVAGDCHPEATIRPLAGRDEEWLYGMPGDTPLATLVTDLLLRCVGRLGPSRPDRDIIGSLLVADRGYLMLKLHQATFGGRMEMVLTCPRPACEARMDVDFQLDDLPVRRDPQQPSYRLECDGTWPDVRFRLPRGSDLEEVRAGPGAATALLERCVLVRAEGGDGLNEELRTSLEAEMERRSPGVDCDIEAACPECGHVFEAVYDPVTCLFADIWRQRPEFERDVHLLSFYYHWPLSEILRMTRPRRRAYVALLERQHDLAGAGAAATGWAS